MQITSATQLQLSPQSPSKKVEDSSGTFAAVVQSLGALQSPSVLPSRQTALGETPAQTQSSGDETAALLADKSGGDPALVDKVAFAAARSLADQNQGLQPVNSKSAQALASASPSEMPSRALQAGLVVTPHNLIIDRTPHPESPHKTGQSGTPHAGTNAALEHPSPPAKGPELPLLQDLPAPQHEQVSSEMFPLPGLPASPAQPDLLKEAAIYAEPRPVVTTDSVSLHRVDSIPAQTDLRRPPLHPATSRDQNVLDMLARPAPHMPPAQPRLSQTTGGQSLGIQEIPVAAVDAATAPVDSIPTQAIHEAVSFEVSQPGSRMPPAQPNLTQATSPPSATKQQTPVASAGPATQTSSIPPQADMPRQSLIQTHPRPPNEQVARGSILPTGSLYFPGRNAPAQNPANSDLRSATPTDEIPRHTGTPLLASPRQATPYSLSSPLVPEIAPINRALQPPPPPVVQANQNVTTGVHSPVTPRLTSEAPESQKATGDEPTAAPAQFHERPARSEHDSPAVALKADGNGLHAPFHEREKMRILAQPVAASTGLAKPADTSATSAPDQTNPAITPAHPVSGAPPFLDTPTQSLTESRRSGAKAAGISKTNAPESAMPRKTINTNSVLPGENSAQHLTAKAPPDKSASVRSEAASNWQDRPQQYDPAPPRTGQQTYVSPAASALPRQDQGAGPSRVPQETSAALAIAQPVQATASPNAPVTPASAAHPADDKAAQPPTAPPHRQWPIHVAEPDPQTAASHAAMPPAKEELTHQNTRSPSITGSALAADIRTAPQSRDPVRNAAATDAALASTDMPPLNREGALQSLPAPFTSSSLPASAGPPPVAHQVAQSIIHSLKMGGDGPIALTLRPEELGQLRFEISTTGDRLAVILFVERPEAMELIRRHGDQLLSDLRLSGFNQPTLSFGDWAQRDGRAGTASGHAPASTEPVAEGDSHAITAPPQHFTAIGRLDLRL